jgi:hypothetical protein
VRRILKKGFNMARDAHDRDDLMREATALVRRVELQLPGHSQTCIVGFRRSGEASIFVGADLVFQFNGAGELRRGFWNGRLVKAESGRLIHLERRPAETEIQLVRHTLTDAETIEFFGLANETLSLLRRVLHSGELVILKQVPADLDIASDLADWLDSLPQLIAIASAPNVRT